MYIVYSYCIRHTLIDLRQTRKPVHCFFASAAWEHNLEEEILRVFITSEHVAMPAKGMAFLSTAPFGCDRIPSLLRKMPFVCSYVFSAHLNRCVANGAALDTVRAFNVAEHDRITLGCIHIRKICGDER